MATLVAGLLPLPVLFMIGFAIALVVNYPELCRNSGTASPHTPQRPGGVAVIFAAGIFSGILSGTEMVDAMAPAWSTVVPPALGPAFLAVITGLC